MCMMASFVLTKSKAYFSADSDSHEDIISEHKLSRLDTPDNVGLVRLEIVPTNDNYSLPLDHWEYRLDQDVLPDRYEAADCERRASHEL